jgi:hypothetical protein
VELGTATDPLIIPDPVDKDLNLASETRNFELATFDISEQTPAQRICMAFPLVEFLIIDHFMSYICYLISIT